MRVGAPILTSAEAAERLGASDAAGAVTGPEMTEASVTGTGPIRSGLAGAATDVAELLEAARLPGGLDKPSRVRRLRISARRLQSLAELLDGNAKPKLRERARKDSRLLRRVLSELRSLDAVSKLLRTRQVPGGGVDSETSAWLAGWCAHRRRGVMAQTARAMDGLGDFRRLASTLERAKPGAGTDPAVVLARACRATADREPQGTPLPEAEDMHRLRVGFKRARFAMEALAPRLGDEDGAVGAGLAGRYAWVFTAQRALGSVSDAADTGVVIELAASDATGRGTPERVRALAEAWPERLRLERERCWAWWRSHRALVLGALGVRETAPGVGGGGRVDKGVDRLMRASDDAGGPEAGGGLDTGDGLVGRARRGA
ncbi:MAG: CHAD domain-containing protein [Planctomycetota bacterium]